MPSINQVNINSLVPPPKKNKKNCTFSLYCVLLFINIRSHVKRLRSIVIIFIIKSLSAPIKLDVLTVNL